MKRTITICIMFSMLIANRSLSQDGNLPLNGIINIEDDMPAIENADNSTDQDIQDMMLTTTCDSMLSTMAGGNGDRGNMFDVTAINALKITKFDVHLDSFKVTTYRVYYHF